MDRDDVERVVVSQAELQRNRQVADASGNHPDGQRTPDAHETGTRCDGHQAGDRPRGGSQGGGVPAFEPFHDEPATHSRRRGDVGVDERLGGDGIGPQGGAGVEPEPAEPQDAGAEQSQGERVRRHGLTGPTLALAQNHNQRQRGDTRIDVHDRSASEVECAPLKQPSSWTEDPVGHYRVDDHRPDPEEQNPCGELQAVSGCAGDQGRSDHREHHLEGHEGHGGNGQRPIAEAGDLGEIGEAEVVERPDEPAADVLTEGQAESEDHPQHADEPEAEEVLHEHAEDILRTHHPGVEERQARHHEQHKGGRGQDPSGVPRIDCWQ